MNARTASLSLACPLLLTGVLGCSSTREAESVADHLALFQPPAVNPVSDTRAADGRPGPAYWQQQADYVIEATLEPESRRVTARGTLIYTNNSPMDLPYLWFELPVDAFRDTSRSSAIRHVNTRFRASGPDMGFRDLAFTLDGEAVEHVVSDTRALVRLPSPVPASGGVVEIGLEWSYRVPEGSNRQGVLEFEGDELYEIARWIPQPCVYDDVYGWNTLPYLGAGESYSDFGNYDVTVRAPEGVTVAAGGVWLNPEACLNAEQLERYTQTLRSDEPVWVITPEEAEASGREENRADAGGDGTPMVSWRYRANDVRTFAFVAGRTYAMDGASVEIDGERVRVLSVYPPGVAGLWHEVSTPAARHALAFYSGFLGLDYPYPVMVNAFGVEGGTEYPMIVFCGSRQPSKPEAPDDPDAVVTLEDGTETTRGAQHEEAMERYRQRYDRAKRGLFSVTDHEVLHAWFPMVVGNDERRDGWMDEGFNEFGNPYSAVAWREKQGEDDAAGEDGVSGQSGTASFDASDANSVTRNISRYAFSRPVPPILEWPDRSQAYGARGLNVYSKPAAGLITLREAILGPERFDHAMKTYLNAWAFKHPRPGDFFRSMENAAGEDLGWFWRGWFASTDTLDLAVTGVEYTQPERGEPYWGVTLEMVGDIPAPVDVRVEFESGEQVVRRVPVEAWYGGRSFTLRLKGETRTPFSVLIDPERVLPDADRDNNRWQGR
ncbi:MAG: M1 family metallopeptidase [Phycisphaerales bacterium JB040]